LFGAISRGEFDISYASLAEGFLLDRIPGRRGALVMPVALIFDGGYRPTTRINNENVDPLAVDRVKGILIRRPEDFPEASLREDAIPPGTLPLYRLR
jgi:hypothetical protein